MIARALLRLILRKFGQVQLLVTFKEFVVSPENIDEKLEKFESDLGHIWVWDVVLIFTAWCFFYYFFEILSQSFDVQFREIWRLFWVLLSVFRISVSLESNGSRGFLHDMVFIQIENKCSIMDAFFSFTLKVLLNTHDVWHGSVDEIN